MRTLILISLVAFLSFPVFSQPGSPAIDKLASRLDSLAKSNSQELVYLQTDKNIYETGKELIKVLQKFLRIYKE